MKERRRGNERFYLMQRGRFQTKDRHTDPSSIMGQHGLIDGDYMGSAEFEWGAIPAAMAVMMDEYLEYGLFPTNITHRNGLDKLLVWCRCDWKDIIIKELENYCEKGYGLKERTELPAATKPLSDWEKESQKKRRREGYKPREFDFWWEIQKEWNFMCFFSGGSRRSSFEKTIASGYNDWWMMLTDEERDERLKKARERMRM